MQDKTFHGTLQHKEHRQWLSQLDFYQDEIKIFQNELMKVLHQHADLSLIEHVDEYRSILLKKLAHIDDFRRQIILQEKRLSQNLTPDAEGLWDHNELRTRIMAFFQELEDWKKSFRRFVARNN